MVNKVGDKSWPTFHPRPSFKLGLWGKIHIYYVYYVYIFIIYIIFIYIYIYSLEINHGQHFTPDLVSNSDCEGNTSNRYFRCILRSKAECDIRENFDTNECPNIFVSTKLHEWISEDIHINFFDTNECSNKYLCWKFDEYLNIFEYSCNF